MATTSVVHGDGHESPVVLDGGDGITITEWDIEAYIVERIPPQRREQMLAKGDLYKEIAETLYVTRKLAQEAAAQPGFDDSYATWAATMAYERRVSSQYRAQYVISKLGEVDWESLARETYLVEKQRFKVPARTRASHILVGLKGRSPEQAKALAQDIHARVQAGEDFATLAEQHSEDEGSAKRGGDLGFFTRGKMVKPFEDAVFALTEVGDTSDVVESQFGFHIIKLTDRRPEGIQSFEEVKDTLIGEIQTSRGDGLWKDKVIRLRSSPSLQWDEEALKRVAETTPKKILGK